MVYCKTLPRTPSALSARPNAENQLRGFEELKVSKTNADDVIDLFRFMYKLLIKEARNKLSFFDTNKYILFLDIIRVIISRRNLARVLQYRGPSLQNIFFLLK